MDIATPIIFSDGTALYDELAKSYIRHESGLFILAPSGAGKSFFIDRQSEKHWIDGDYLWPSANADPTNDEWVNDDDLVEWVNQKSDIITCQAKKLGFWIIGSSNSFLKPDAIVIPDWEVHKSYIENRDKASYDGGARIADLSGVLKHREIIERWKSYDVPCYESVQDAAHALYKFDDK
jgi:hypothetical protein